MEYKVKQKKTKCPKLFIKIDEICIKAIMQKQWGHLRYSLRNEKRPPELAL